MLVPQVPYLIVGEPETRVWSLLHRLARFIGEAPDVFSTTCGTADQLVEKVFFVRAEDTAGGGCATSFTPKLLGGLKKKSTVYFCTDLQIPEWHDHEGELYFHNGIDEKGHPICQVLPNLKFWRMRDDFLHFSIPSRKPEAGQDLIVKCRERASAFPQECGKT